jgi:uncharacterized protein related to proFAR isomerase
VKYLVLTKIKYKDEYNHYLYEDIIQKINKNFDIEFIRINNSNFKKIANELLHTKTKKTTFIDVVQVGTRNFKNYSLLDALGKIDKPVMLKKGTWCNINE